MEKVIITHQKIQSQLGVFFKKYPQLSIKSDGLDSITLSGSIKVFRAHNGFTVNKLYTLDIVIPIGSNVLPYVLDTGNHIDSQYPHYYATSKQFCLETDSRIALRFIDGFSLVDWVDEFVEPYYFSYEYYQRFGEFPFGERSHGTLGVLESYQDYFSANDIAQAYNILTFVCNSPYRGHQPCPCGSKRKLRNCHGKKILTVYQNPAIMRLIKEDYPNIIKYVKQQGAESKSIHSKILKKSMHLI